MKTFLESFGWYGAVAILAAYVLISFAFVGADNAWYQALNMTGGAGLTAIATYKKDWQLVIVNAIWATIALIALVRILL